MTSIDEFKEYLSILELDKETEIDEAKLKKAYIKASKKYHPDVCEDKYKDGVMFKKVNLANTFIKDNLSMVNDYLKNPNKYSNMYQNRYNTNQEYRYNNTYHYFYGQPHYFYRGFNRTFTKEEMEEIRKERRARRKRIKIYSACALAFGVLISFVSPLLGVFVIVMSLSQLLFN